MADPARHLRIVDAESGEILPECPGCADRQTKLDELTRKYHGALAQIGNLRRDKEAEARKHKTWPKASRLFDVWRHVCDHEGAKWTADRFWEAEPFLRSHGEIRCCRAILGAAADPFTKRRKNGTTQRYDDWSLIFRSAAKLEDFEARAPLRFTDEYIRAKLDGEAEPRDA